MQSLRLALRGAMVLVLLAAAVTDRAHAQGRLEARYVGTMHGIPVGSGTLIVEIGSDRYTAAASGHVTSLLRLLTSGEGTGDAQGRVQGGRLMPTTYSADIRTVLESYHVRMAVDGGTVKELIGVPPIASGGVPLSPEHQRGITDPLSGALIPVAGSGDVLDPTACQRRLAIFDGRQRFDLALAFKAMATVKAEKGYEGPVVVCSMNYQPVAGHHPGQFELRFLGHRRDIEVWLAPIAGTRFLAPFRILIPTALGPGVLEATRFETVATALARPLPPVRAPHPASVPAPPAATPAVLAAAAPASLPAMAPAPPAPAQVAVTTTEPAAIGPVVGDAGRRLALVIGNGAYVNSSPLANPANDARMVGRTLRDLGFDVIEGTDLDRVGMERLIREFLHKASSVRLALLYYAGHGMQVDGKNYLIPIDAKLAEPSDLGFEALEMDKILFGLDNAARANIVILDACRDNPLARSFARGLGATRSAAVAGGLAGYAAAGTGTLIAFATAPGQFALDRTSPENPDSPFTTALLRHMRTRGIEVNQMLARVRIDVAAATANKQVPWVSSSLLGEVYLAGAPTPLDRP